MSISNLGGIGGMAFTPIVNPPEVAILGLTRTELVPVWDGTSWLPVPMVPLDLSYDHRVVNGADAARFLARYAKLLGDLRHLLDP
jgi:pyruvate/2-oxoglutarate dehydrogenase complex dihydrolipoamide acyltransferase (E2) component